MSDEDVNDYLVRGMYGPKELRPDEKHRYLGTYRERVVAVLTQSQVRKKSLYAEIPRLIARYPQATMLLNGEMEYEALSKYIRLAAQYKIPYNKFSEHDGDSDLGLVLALPYAVEIDHIEIADPEEPEEPAREQTTENRQPSNLFKRMFKRKS